MQKSATRTEMAHALGRRRDEPERSNASVQSARARADPPRAILPPPADPTPPLHLLPTEQRERERERERERDRDREKEKERETEREKERGTVLVNNKWSSLDGVSVKIGNTWLPSTSVFSD